MVLSPQAVASRLLSGLNDRPSTLLACGKSASSLVSVRASQRRHLTAQRTGGNQAAVGAGGDPIARRVSGQDFDRGAARHVPHADRLVITHAGELVPVGAEGHVQGRTPCAL